MDLLQDQPDGPRMLYRSSHLYLFLTGAINIALGTTTAPASEGFLDKITSALFLIAPLIMVVSFFLESGTENLNRPLSAIALQLVFAATTVLALRAFGFGRAAAGAGEPTRL